MNQNAKNESQIHDAEWEVAKHRGGPARMVHLRWEPKTTTSADEYYGGPKWLK